MTGGWSVSRYGLQFAELGCKSPRLPDSTNIGTKERNSVCTAGKRTDVVRRWPVDRDNCLIRHGNEKAIVIQKL